MKKLSLILLTIFLINTEAPAQVAPPKDGPVVVETNIVSRLRSVNTLIHKSSVVSRIEVSGNESAIAMLNESRELYSLAESQHKDNQDVEAGKTLNLCVAKLMQASREAKTSLDDLEYQTRLYQDRLASVEALLAAHHRVAVGKDIVAEKKVIEEQVRNKISLAQSQVEQQKIPEGQIILNEAYLTLKVSIFSMRNGDTVNSPKEFPTIQDHYNYELDRVQSYRMLIFVLVRGASPRTVEQIERLVTNGDELVKLAHTQAESGEFKTAIGTLNSAARYFARAIQTGGVYIPE